MAKACLLVAEDQDDFLELLKLVLEGEGFYVATAHDGAEAIKLLEHFRPALIITDLMMPKVTGLELIRHVRSEAKLKEIPIIAASAAQSGSLREARAAGANEVIQKPMDFDRLVLLINQYVPTHAPLSGAPQAENAPGGGD